MAPSDNTDNRRFIRIAFDHSALVCQESEQCEHKVIDLSLKGILIDERSDTTVDYKKVDVIHVNLTDDLQISMEVTWRHSENGHVGFECHHIDLDSITHLRRLVELNTGDTELLERELTNLG